MMITLLLLTFFLSSIYFAKLIKSIPSFIRILISGSISLLVISSMNFLFILGKIQLQWGLFVLILFFLFEIIRMRKKFSLAIKWPNDSLLLWVILMGLSTIFYQKFTLPWGGWDAVAIWNLHAKFLADTDHWQNMFDSALSWSHPDYPLFLPSLIALGWVSLSEIDPIIPMLIGLIPLLGIISLLFFAIENRLLGIIAAFVILFDPHFTTQAASQYADTWLAFFLLMAIYLLNQLPSKPNLTWSLGIIVSACGWIKNEGLIIFCLISLGVIILLWNNKKQLFVYAISCCPILLIWLVVKLMIPTSNDMISESDTSVFSKLISIDRYMTIGQFMKNTILDDFPVLPGLLLIGIFITKKIGWPVKPSSSILLVILVIYCSIYLVTPKDLNWHLSTSFYRLMHQIYPGFLLNYFMYLEKNTIRIAFR